MAPCQLGYLHRILDKPISDQIFVFPESGEDSLEAELARLSAKIIMIATFRDSIQTMDRRTRFESEEVVRAHRGVHHGKCALV